MPTDVACRKILSTVSVRAVFGRNTQALKRGLVDRIGGMDTAVSEAAALAGITDYSVVQGNEQKSFFEKYLGKMQDDVRVTMLRSVMGEESFQMYTTLQRMKSVSGIQARMPYLIQGF